MSIYQLTFFIVIFIVPLIISIHSTPVDVASVGDSINERGQRIKKAFQEYLIQHKIQQKRLRRQRYEYCLLVFKSPSICRNSTSFYLWARLVAQDIMEGKNTIN